MLLASTIVAGIDVNGYAGRLPRQATRPVEALGLFTLDGYVPRTELASA